MAPESKVKCRINGQEVEVAEGTSIIEAYGQIKQDIAHYCWHPELSIAGVCRLCVVEIEGNPKLQIACNTKVQEGMVISNKSPQVEEAVRWGLDFHLINHPLDCPICDQAGECGLQEQYMKYGSYDSSMSENKVKKRKVIDLGPKVVLDAERCILCSRCVRFTEEITKTNELGIFNRGDRSEIGTVKDNPLDNDYSLNTVDICPVGALTSKDFRFQQRVWYLQNTETTCPGCSTGCSVHVYHNKEGVFRLKPNTKDQHWMCDEGRDVYKHTNVKERLLSSKRLNSNKVLQSVKLSDAIKASLEMIENAKGSVSLILTAQHTNEEYQALKEGFPEKTVHHWKNFDGEDAALDKILKRKDKNPNTKGFKANFPTDSSFEVVSKNELVIVALPENKSLYSDFNGMLSKIKSFKKVIILTVGSFDEEGIESEQMLCIPMKSFVEKFGTYTNFNNEERNIQKAVSLVTEAVSLEDFIGLLKGEEISVISEYEKATQKKRNEFLNKVEL